MMNPTMGDPGAVETLIAGLEWHQKHEPGEAVSLDPAQAEAMLGALRHDQVVVNALAWALDTIDKLDARLEEHGDGAASESYACKKEIARIALERARACHSQ